GSKDGSTGGSSLLIALPFLWGLSRLGLPLSVGRSAGASPRVRPLGCCTWDMNAAGGGIVTGARRTPVRPSRAPRKARDGGAVAPREAGGSRRDVVGARRWSHGQLVGEEVAALAGVLHGLVGASEQASFDEEAGLDEPSFEVVGLVELEVERDG